MILGLFSLDCMSYKEREFEISKKIEELSKNGTIRCPNCNSKVKIHGAYNRKVIFSEDEVIVVKIFQIRCANKNCRRVHAVIPDFIFPQKQYCYEIITNAILNNQYETCCADNSTIRRWKTGTSKFAAFGHIKN